VSDDLWIVVPNWDKFQHYKDRDPVWIKLFTELRNKDEWRHLTLAQRGLLVSIWIEYAAANGQLRAADLPSLILQKLPLNSLDSLNHTGLIQLCASKPAQIASTRARPRTREETETERDSPKSPHRRKPDERVFARPDTVCPDCGETLGQGHLESCPRMPKLADDLLEEARQ
jgi:hypothetical protein